MKNDQFQGIFIRLVPFPQVFGQVKGWLIIKLHKIIEVSHAVVCRVKFFLFYVRCWQRGVFKIMKTRHFLVF